MMSNASELSEKKQGTTGTNSEVWRVVRWVVGSQAVVNMADSEAKIPEATEVTVVGSMAMVEDMAEMLLGFKTRVAAKTNSRNMTNLMMAR